MGTYQEVEERCGERVKGTRDEWSILMVFNVRPKRSGLVYGGKNGRKKLSVINKCSIKMSLFYMI